MSNLQLRFITVDDTENIVKWRNSPAVRKNLFTQSVLTTEQHRKWLNDYVIPGFCQQFIIEIETAGKIMPIGTAFIKNIIKADRTGEFGIFIGEEAATGHGYGYQATKKTLEYAFSELKLQCVWLSVYANNKGAVHIYQKLGFQTKKVLNRESSDAQVSHDVLVMEINREQWLSNENT